MKKEELNAAGLELRILAGVISKTAGRDLERHLEVCSAGMSALQYGVLRLLGHHQCTIAELSRTMLLAPATLVPVVDALESKGLLKRERDPQDRRRTPLLLTPQGVEMLSRVPHVSADDALVRSLQLMGDVKSQQLIALLRELVSGLPNGPHVVRAVESRLHTGAVSE